MSEIVRGLIPKIEGFQPIPNAVMIPFMEAQSAALAYGFGLNYEYGKRKIRSMSNEQYNSLTSEDITNMSNEHTHIILSKFQAQVPAVMPMQQEIFKQYVIIEKAKVQQNFELAKWMLSFIKEISDDALAHLMGGHLHGEIIDKPFVTPEDKFINPKTGEQGSEAPSTPTASEIAKQKHVQEGHPDHYNIKYRTTQTSSVSTKHHSLTAIIGLLKAWRNRLDVLGPMKKSYKVTSEIQYLLQNVTWVSTKMKQLTGKWY